MKYVCTPVPEPRFDARMRDSIMLAKLTDAEMKAFFPNHYPNTRVDALEENLQTVSETAEAAEQTATQALEDAATADGKAVAAQEAADTNSGRLNSLETLTVETFSEAYQLVAADSNKVKRCTSAVDVNLTIPADLTLPLPVAIEQAGNGIVTVVGADGVTVNGDPKTAGQYKYIVIVKVAANVYSIIGGIS